MTKSLPETLLLSNNSLYPGNCGIYLHIFCPPQASPNSFVHVTFLKNFGKIMIQAFSYLNINTYQNMMVEVGVGVAAEVGNFAYQMFDILKSNTMH